MEPNNFQISGYKFLKGLIDPTIFYLYLKHLEKIGHGTIDNKTGLVGFYKVDIFEKLLVSLLPTIERHCGYNLYKTYSYARNYHIGDELKIHTDRPACEITASINVGYEGSIWPIWLKDKENKAQSFNLQPGDAIIFKGMELPHWREVNHFGNSSQIFLHYVAQDGPYSLYKDDVKNNKY